MKLIPLTRGKFAKVDDADYAELSKYNWQAYRSNRVWYARRKGAKGEPLVQMHKQLMKPPTGKRVDHHDSDGLNNRRYNLRTCNHYQNSCNRRKQSRLASSRYKGVYWNKECRLWRASIRVLGKLMHLGQFTKERRAALAYDAASKAHHGEFGRTNFA